MQLVISDFLIAAQTMQPQQWILLIAGLLIILVGVSLMAYSVIAKRAMAGKAGATKGSAIEGILRALANLIKVVGDFLGANMAGKVGFLVVIVGFGLLYLSLHA
jgi:hypothetical protein